MKRLIIECGVAETRAALLIDDVVWKFWFGPARGDEALDFFPHAGRRYAGRVKAVDQGLNAAFVVLGDGRDAFLALKKSIEAHCIDGALIDVEIKAPPRQLKGAALRFVGPLKEGAPGRLPPFQDAAVEAAETIGADADEIIIDDGAALRALQAAEFDNARHETHPVSLFEKYGADHEFEAAFEREVLLMAGGRLIIDEAHALAAIDVDSAGLTASSPARLREKIAFAAAHEALRQVSLRNIGGHVVIDFPDIPGDAGRKRFQTHLRELMTRLDGAGAASFSRSGLYSFTAPHHALSLLDRFTEQNDAAPIPGRRFTVEAAAKMAVAKLERQLTSAPSKRFRVSADKRLAGCIKDNAIWFDRLTQRYGPRFDLAEDKTSGDWRFDLAEQ